MDTMDGRDIKQGVIDAVKSFDGRAGVTSTLVAFARSLVINPKKGVMSEDEYQLYEQWEENQSPFEQFEYNSSDLTKKQFEKDDVPF